MAITAFPDVKLADENGLLAVGGDTEPESLLLAYRSGIFPWPISNEYLTWFAPPERALLYPQQAHISKSLKKFSKQHPYTITVNQHFDEVITKCSELVNRPTQYGTWITAEIQDGYRALFRQGNAYSIECMEGDEIIGGLYGVTIGQMYSGESMFYRKPNASKLCLLYLIEALKKHKIPWLDCQVVTPLLTTFGALPVPRAQYMKKLQEQISLPALHIFEK